MLITTAGTILKGLWQGVLLWEAFIRGKKKPKKRSLENFVGV